MLTSKKGGTVPQGEWVTSQTFSGEGQRPLSAIPRDLADIAARAATPAPGPAVTDDEREDFLRRENELSDQLAEKEAELKNHRASVTTLNEELAFLKAKDAESAAVRTSYTFENAGKWSVKAPVHFNRKTRN